MTHEADENRMSVKIQQALKDREWWEQFEHDGWRLSGFSERYTASFHRGGFPFHTIRVYGSFMRGLKREATK